MSCIRTVKDRTSDPLGAAGEYASPGIKVELYNQIRGLASADQGGTVEFHESFDGLTWYKTSSEAVTGGTPIGFAFVCHAYYAMVKYVNGADAQTTFDLQVYVDPFV
ncbi:hypothetical protein [Paenibacillus agaridevorans]|uniref:hypothetical protein n=1 Tax=Paenibacillus agaridevorans TaxID=171404 RepID=UPI001BE430CB|nr:hypothetical protein [Paenibacillus agaridevorans]